MSAEVTTVPNVIERRLPDGVHQAVYSISNYLNVRAAQPLDNLDIPRAQALYNEAEKYASQCTNSDRALQLLGFIDKFFVPLEIVKTADVRDNENLKIEGKIRRRFCHSLDSAKTFKHVHSLEARRILEIIAVGISDEYLGGNMNSRVIQDAIALEFGLGTWKELHEQFKSQCDVTSFQLMGQFIRGQSPIFFRRDNLN